MRKHSLFVLAGWLPLLLGACQPCVPCRDSKQQESSGSKASSWVDVAPTQAAWTYVDFGSNAGVDFEAGEILLRQGERLEGITYAGDAAALLGPALDHYEIKLQVARISGHDILLGLTFPVGDKQSASLVLGGWGGNLCGISSVDGHDASSNAWKSIRTFTDNQWHDVTVRVDGKEVAATLDRQELFAVPRAGHQFGLRAEVEPTAPLGLFTFATAAKVRAVAVRRLK